MKEILFSVLLLFFLNIYHPAMSDEVAQKTDASFVGYNSAFTGQDLQKQVDNTFVGDNTEPDVNSDFAGDNTDRDVHQETDAPFEQDHSKEAKEGVFIGQDVRNQTDASFTESNYGK